MDLAELKLISASNIIRLRTNAGMTQAELGGKLNYSDKTISKWERGEAIPDAFVLTQMAELFGVSVDYLLSSHDRWETQKKKTSDGDEPRYSANMIIAIVIVSIMTFALTIFVGAWIADVIEWRIFLFGGIVSILAYMVLDCVFKKAKHLTVSLSAFILSLLTGVYFTFPEMHLWQIFILAVPAIIIVYMGCNIRRKPHKKQKTEPETVQET